MVTMGENERKILCRLISQFYREPEMKEVPLPPRIRQVKEKVWVEEIRDKTVEVDDGPTPHSKRTKLFPHNVGTAVILPPYLCSITT